MKRISVVVCVGVLSLFPGPRPPECAMLAVELSSGRTLFEEGAVDERHSPCSSFKIPIALMGFDAGILTTPETPVMDYKPEYGASREKDKASFSPRAWLRESVVWYSQQITRSLGEDRFGAYVKRFDYGNKDLRGHAGSNDGLTQAWLMSSLAVSPREQVRFLRRMVLGELGLKPRTLSNVLETLPVYAAEGGWTVRGKSGSGWLTDARGAALEDRPMGWFVGLAEKGAQRTVFARCETGFEKSARYFGQIARDHVLSNLGADLRPW